MNNRNISCLSFSNDTAVRFLCPNSLAVEDLSFNHLQQSLDNTVEYLEIVGPSEGFSGPLTAIPVSACRFKQLKVNIYAYVLLTIF